MPDLIEFEPGEDEHLEAQYEDQYLDDAQMIYEGYGYEPSPYDGTYSED